MGVERALRGELKVVEKQAGALGADAGGGEGLEDGIERGAHVGVAFQSRKLKRLVGRGFSRRGGIARARVKVAIGKAPEGRRMTLESVGLDVTTFCGDFHFSSHGYPLPPYPYPRFTGKFLMRCELRSAPTPDPAIY